ncbi:hypothetical protein NST02_03875 [Robertmurraya sp. FSL W8-0741]
MDGLGVGLNLGVIDSVGCEFFYFVPLPVLLRFERKFGEVG